MYTIGADPEVFLQNKETKQVVAACGKFGGTKKKRRAMTGLPSKYGLQEDNIMLEFNIPPATTWRAFFSNIGLALSWINVLLSDQFPELELSTKCGYQVPGTQLLHPKAREFGCAPDYNAYENGNIYPRLSPAELLADGDSEWRFAGGHIHLGYTAQIPHHIVAQFFDAYIGLISITSGDAQGKRREFYGLAGRYRPTAYGIEYRTLSNYWVIDAPKRNEIAAHTANLGNLLETTALSQLQELYAEIPWLDVREAINTENVPLALKLRDYIGALTP